jgi:NAD(P)H dehydrogenase (quinone)
LLVRRDHFERSIHLIVVTGSTGQLGRLVIASLLERRVPANHIVAAARTPSKAADLAALGVQLREADYGKPPYPGRP